MTLTRFGRLGKGKFGTIQPGGGDGQISTNLNQGIQKKLKRNSRSKLFNSLKVAGKIERG
jgi:hypothetical protein